MDFPGLEVFNSDIIHVPVSVPGTDYVNVLFANRWCRLLLGRFSDVSVTVPSALSMLLLGLGLVGTRRGEEIQIVNYQYRKEERQSRLALPFLCA